MPIDVVPGASGVNTTSPPPCAHAVHVCAHRPAVVDERGDVPGVGGVRAAPRSSSVRPGAGDRRNVSSAQRPSGRIRSSTRARFSLVPASCTCTKRCSSGPPAAGWNTTSMVNRAESRQRVGVDDQAVVDAVELDRGAVGAVDDARRADDLDGVAADAGRGCRPATRPAAPGHRRARRVALRRDTGRDERRQAGDDGQRRHERSSRLGRGRGSARPCCGCRPRSRCPSASGRDTARCRSRRRRGSAEKSPGADGLGPPDRWYGWLL